MLSSDTKTKILHAANSLFAKHGFAGASVRDIASGADVNLSAVNYHFKNKVNLYWSVFDFNYSFLEKGVIEIGERTETTAELTKEVFRFFMSDRSALMNTFKIILADDISKPKNQKESDHFGPPGEKTFLSKIRFDLESSGHSNVSEEGVLWVMKMIFALLVHYSVILNTKVMAIKGKQDKTLRPEEIEKAILYSVEAHLNFIKKDSKLFT